MSWRTPAAAALAAALACAGGAPEPAPRTAELEELSAGGYAMGTVLELTLLGADAAALERGRARALAEIERLEALLSRWRPDSEISRLNAAAGTGYVELDPEVAALLERSVALSYDTLGSFDVSVGPLVELWTESAARGRLPAPDLLKAARGRVGPGRLRFAEGARVWLDADSAVDLGGVAKGYALDRARAKLGPGVEAALLNFGQSSSWAIGRPPGLEGWRLLVRAPDDAGFAGMVTLRDQALSASGSLGQWAEIEGRRYGHVLDPRSGEPLTLRRQAVVVTTDATRAEALSKAVLILGEGEGLTLIESMADAEALLLDADGGAWRTSGWDRATRFEPLTPQVDAPPPPVP